MKITFTFFIILFLVGLISNSEAQTTTFYNYSFNDSGYKSFTVFDTSSSNPWQVGHTLKSYLNPDSIPDNLLVTDTVNPYPSNGNWSVTLKIPSIEDVTECFFQNPVWNLNNGDSVFFEASFDTGRTWLNVLASRPFNLNPFPFFIYSEYLSLADSSVGYSYPIALTGTFRAKRLHISIEYVAIERIEERTEGIYNNPDSIYFRIRLQSNSGVPAQGFALSGFQVYEYTPSGVTSVYANNFVKVFPNPANDYLQLNFSSPKQNLQYSIVNILGQAEAGGVLPLNKSQASVDISRLTSGIYFIRVIGANGLVDGNKFIKK